MNIKEQLPYLGKRQKDETICFLNIEIKRPEYEGININSYLGKYECICLLLGIDIISLWAAVYHEDSGEFNIIINDINNDINFACQKKDLTPLKRDYYSASVNYPDFGKAASEMKSQPYFKVIEFIQWADSLLYKIPLELEDFKNDIDQNNSIKKQKQKAQELGMLRKEKDKFDSSIQASVMIGLWLKDIDYRITHKNLIEKIQSEYPDIPKTIINNIIWNAIPDEYKNQGGSKKQKK